MKELFQYLHSITWFSEYWFLTLKLLKYVETLKEIKKKNQVANHKIQIKLNHYVVL